GLASTVGLWSSLKGWFKPKPPLAQRYSLQTRVLGRPAPKDATRWPAWLSSGLTPETLSAYTRSADSGEPSQLYALLQEIAARDGLIRGNIETRLSALSQRKLRTVANTADPRTKYLNPEDEADPEKNRAQEVADYGQEVLDNLRLVQPQENSDLRIM